MKTIICTYCEGNDTKIAAIIKEKDTVKLIKAVDFDLYQPKAMQAEAASSLNIDGVSGDFSIIDMDKSSENVTGGISNESMINTALSGIKLQNCEFLPAITEPSIHYHLYEGSKDLPPAKLQDAIIEEILKSKNIAVSRDVLGYVELSGGALLAIFVDGEIHCLNLLNSLAQYNGKRYYKIPAVKSAEVSLAYYVGKKKKFFPDDYSLVVYIGKEYSKLIFLQGTKLKHIGTTLDIGTLNLHTYDVYFSKILLEMENGGIPRLDNVVLCGEDDSENLILSFYGTFPEANVSRLEFDDCDISAISEGTREKISAFSVPIAVAYEYFDEIDNHYKGINLLPRYVKEDQKFFQFGWHSYAMLPILFAVSFFLTQNILINHKKINELNNKIEELTFKQKSNQQILDKITYYDNKIANFDVTKQILDSASAGSGTWTKMSIGMAEFIGMHKSMWITSVTVDEKKQVVASGYGLSRSVITDFSDTYNFSLLKNVSFESLRSSDAYKFNLNFDLLNFTGEKK